MPKTGTTAIQDYFAANRAALRQNGLLYPGSAVDHADLLPLFHQRGPQHFYYRQRGVSESDALATAHSLRTEIQRELSAFSGDALLSSEYFYSVGPKRLKQLAAFFGELGFAFRVVVYVRHPVSAAISHANQDIKMGKRTLAECSGDPRWHSNRKTLETLSSVISRDDLIVRDYEAVAGRNCVRDILEVCGYRGDVGASDPRHSNVSLSMAGAVLADACHKLKAANPSLQIDQSFVYQIGGPKFTLPDTAIAQIRERGVEEIAWIEEHFGIKLVEPSLSGVFSNTLDPEAVLQLTEYIAALQSTPLTKLRRLLGDRRNSRTLT
ncbi:MAG: hypothetical protein NW206_10250 [Hyphomonadaceae bacterium]|nr:hypothetical protein [Hyphomonadaceae bacterium]